jgi:hypothetical protein
LVRAVAGPALVLVVLVALTACAESYPGEVTAPELVGLVTSSTTDQDLTAHIVLADGLSWSSHGRTASSAALESCS